MIPKTKALSADVKLSPDDERTVVCKMSTVTVDREGEVLVAQGCSYRNFKSNPVVMLQHNYAPAAYGSPPPSPSKVVVGKVVAIQKSDEAVTAKIQFLPRPSDYPVTKEWVPSTLFHLYKEEAMNAFSVGFQPIEGRAATNYDKTKYGEGCCYVHGKWDLLELSCVYLPCNPDAVATAVSKGILTQAAIDQLAKGECEDEDDKKSADDDTDNSPEMMACAKCAKEYSADEMDEHDGEMICKECHKAATDEPAESDKKDDGDVGEKSLHRESVIESIDVAPIHEKSDDRQSVHVVLDMPSRQGISEKAFEEIVANTARRQIAKARGVIYIN